MRKKGQQEKLHYTAYIERYFAIGFATCITLLNVIWLKIEFWGKEYVLADKSIDVSLWYFGVLFTMITIVHQGSNEKINNMRKRGSINRLNALNRRAVLLSLFAAFFGLLVYSGLDAGNDLMIAHSFLVYNVLVFVWVWLVADLVLFLLVFYNLFRESKT